ncbi:Vacuolar protein sorting 18-like protein [Euroglyphus maynei]|uniref:Vacuolar protein sorting 18-like protein n=1 Tax=Euroglyphus maynei TaxID=6958 RepID=A0A1Y3AZP3_EURMA|nr:Vacuolar protein sorting 18-like protein [Euroglyphus maynei]
MKNFDICILIATRNFIYQYIGKITQPSTTPIIGSCGSSNSITDSNQSIDGQPYLYQIIQSTNSRRSFKEMPGYIPVTKLDLFQPSSTISTAVDQPLSFGWLTEPGIFYGDIDNEQKIFDNATVIMYSDLNQSIVEKDHQSSNNQGQQQLSMPKSLALTRFHLMLLYGQKLSVYCVLNRELIWEDRFLGEPAENLVKDPIRNTIWSYTKNSVYRYRINQEDRNIWEIYLKRKDFEQAKRYARNDLIKMDRTICEEALYHFANKDYKKSAKLFTQTQSISFEEIALKFIELRDENQDALKEFLLNKLERLSTTVTAEKHQTQIIILLLWLFELMLNQLSRLQSSAKDSSITDDDDGEKLKYEQEQQVVEQCLKRLISNANYRQSFRSNRKIFYNLLLNHDNWEMLEYFAEEINDFDCLLEHYCRRNDYRQMIQLMRREECLEYYYQYSPILIKYLPKELIDCLIPLASELDMKRLIPSLVHFDHFDDDNRNDDYDESRHRQCKEILRFLEFCVYELKINDSMRQQQC